MGLKPLRHQVKILNKWIYKVFKTHNENSQSQFIILNKESFDFMLIDVPEDSNLLYQSLVLVLQLMHTILQSSDIVLLFLPILSRRLAGSNNNYTITIWAFLPDPVVFHAYDDNYTGAWIDLYVFEHYLKNVNNHLYQFLIRRSDLICNLSCRFFWSLKFSKTTMLPWGRMEDGLSSWKPLMLPVEPGKTQNKHVKIQD